MARGSEEEVRDLVIEVDTNKIAQVVRNLVSNGLKFTPKDGTVEATLSVQEVTAEDEAVDTNTAGAKYTTNKVLVFSVKDSGAGISPVSECQDVLLPWTLTTDKRVRCVCM